MLNDDEAILVLVDEAHRCQAGDLHADLLAGLPNCARIGFTGTPIIMGDKKRTHEIFGEFIDRYTIREAEADGAIVPILYEGRTAQGAVKDGANLDELFEDLFREHTPEELEAIKSEVRHQGQRLRGAGPDRATRRATCCATTSTASCPTASRPRWWPQPAGSGALSGRVPAARDELVAEIETLDPARTTPEAIDRADDCRRRPHVSCARRRIWR